MNIPIKVNIKKPYQLGVVGTPSSGGTGEIPDNSIGTEKLKDQSVTPEKLDREYTELEEYATFKGNVLNFVSNTAKDIEKLEAKKINNPIPTPTSSDVGKVLQIIDDGHHRGRWSAEFVEGVGGGVADGSVTTEKLAEGSVTTDKLADKSVTPFILDRDYATLVNMGIEDIEIPEDVETDVYADVVNDETWFAGVSIPWITDVSSIDEWLSSVKVFKYSNGTEYPLSEEADMFAYKFGNNSVVLVNFGESHTMFLVDESDIGVTYNIVDDADNTIVEASFPKSGFYSQNNIEEGLYRCVKVEFNPELKIDKKYLPDDLLNLSDKYATKEELNDIYTVIDSLVETVGQKFSGIIGGATAFDLTEKDFANVTSVRRYAFYQNASLQNVSLPDNIREIGVNAFRDCTGLLTVKISGYTTIQSGAFYGCTNLTDFYLPDVSSANEVPPLANTAAFTNTTCYFNVSSEEVKAFYVSANNWSTLADRFQVKALPQ